MEMAMLSCRPPPLQLSSAANMQQAMVIMFVVLMPFVLLGLAATISNMPETLQTLHADQPASLCDQHHPSGLSGGCWPGQLAPEMLALVAIAAVTLPFSAWMFRHLG